MLFELREICPFLVARSEDPVMPDYYMSLVKYWLEKSSGGITEVRLKERSEANWVAAGNAILRCLGKEDSQIAVCFNGNCPFRYSLPGWFSQIMADTNHGCVNISFIVNHQPETATRRASWHSDVSWASIQSASDTSWLNSLWLDAKSDAFDYGTDLIVVFLDGSPVRVIPTEFSEKNLSSLLNGSTSWMIPLDGNFGFIVGVPKPHYLEEIAEAVSSALSNVENG